MNAIQFDECFDDLTVIDACNAEGLIQAHRLDDDLFEKKDPEVLAVLMQRSVPMITTDRSLPEDHTDCIPAQNPGIVVVEYCRYYRTIQKTMTSAGASRLLRTFKERVPDWNELEIQNSIIQITQNGAMISHVQGGRLTFDCYLLYEDHKDNLSFQQAIITALDTNSTLYPPRSDEQASGLESPSPEN